MVGHGGSSAGSYLADPTCLIPSHCASIVATSTLRVKMPVYVLTIKMEESEQLCDQHNERILSSAQSSRSLLSIKGLF